MAYDTAGLLDSVDLKLQRNPRFNRALRLDGLNRGIEQLITFASEDYDVKEVLNPVDPVDSSKFAMEFPLPSNTLYLESISFDGVPLRPLSQPQFVGTMAERSLAIAEYPSVYYVRAGLFVNVFPRPASQRTVQIYGLFKPDDLSADTDPIPLTRLYSDALVSYACWWCVQGLPGEEARAESFEKSYFKQRANAKFNKTQSTEHSVLNVKGRYNS